MTQSIGEIDKNAPKKIVISLGICEDKQRIDIRVCSQSNPDNWIPTSNGINISSDEWPEFKALVERVHEKLTRLSATYSDSQTN